MFSLLDEPHWRNLYRFFHIMEHAERERLSRRFERVDSGKMTAMAFHAPELLDDELRSVRDALAAIDKPASDVTSVRARGLAMVARLEASGAFPELLPAGDA